jgi:hypothetical protein
MMAGPETTFDMIHEHVAAIAGQVRRDAAERDHPLCADLLLWQDGRVREYRRKD